MVRTFLSSILLAAYLILAGQPEAACAASPAKVEVTHSHSDEHHHEHRSEAPESQDCQPHTHELVVGGCACYVVPARALRLGEAAVSRTDFLVSEPSDPCATRLQSIFRPPIS